MSASNLGEGRAGFRVVDRVRKMLVAKVLTKMLNLFP
jgi:hypothetical protein